MFRQEALRYHTKKWKSTAILANRLPTWLVFSISFFIFITFIIFIILSSYTRREIVIGELVLQSHPIIISAPKSGYISESYVKIHQSIKKGDPLFKITLERITNSGDININSINLLKSQIKVTEKAIKSLQENRNKTIISLKNQITNYQSIQNDKKNYLIEINESINEYKELIKRYEKLLTLGHSTYDEVNNHKSRYFQQKSVFNSLNQELLQLKSNILNLENEIEVRTIDFDNQIVRYEIQKSDLNIRLMEQESIYEIIVSAPMDGIIESTSVTIGQVIKEGDVLSQIIPENKGGYQLVIWIPNNAIPFVNINDTVNIRYEAFPFEKFGQFEGKIQHISTLPVSLQELNLYKNLPQDAEKNILLYKATVEIKNQDINYNNKKLYFISGMKAEITLFLENRKLYEWMLFPIYTFTKNME